MLSRGDSVDLRDESSAPSFRHPVSEEVPQSGVVRCIEVVDDFSREAVNATLFQRCSLQLSVEEVGDLLLAQ